MSTAKKTEKSGTVVKKANPKKKPSSAGQPVKKKAATTPPKPPKAEDVDADRLSGTPLDEDMQHKDLPKTDEDLMHLEHAEQKNEEKMDTHEEYEEYPEDMIDEHEEKVADRAPGKIGHITLSTEQMHAKGSLNIMVCTTHDCNTPYNPVTLVIADTYERGMSMLAEQLKKNGLRFNDKTVLRPIVPDSPGVAIMSIGMTGINATKKPEERPIVTKEKSLHDRTEWRYYYCINHTSGPLIPPVSFIMAGSDSEAFSYLENALAKLGVKLNDDATVNEIRTSTPLVKFLIPDV